MNVNAWLSYALGVLTDANIATARLDSLVLLEDCLQKDRAHLLAHPELELTRAQEKVLTGQILRRAAYEPLAYIRGKSEFYGRNFMIDHRVLEPRPESETIIDLLKAMKLPAKCVIADIGTGSGMLAITAKLELPATTVIAVDIDSDCLAVARENAKRYRVDIPMFEGNLLAPLAGLSKANAPFVILSNLPYVPDDFHINSAAMHEPKTAIFGGPDGLDHYRHLFEQTDSLDTKPSYILTESLPPQHPDLADIAAAYGYTQQAEDDFIQLFTA
jgi:release factor glutamine methyltransferase